MRIHPLVTVRIPSPNHYAGGLDPELIVLHDTESSDAGGDADLRGVAGYFAESSTQASAHVIVNAAGHSARCVRDVDAAWHVAAFNGEALGIEQIGFATLGARGWLRRSRQLHETARWIAYWHRRHAIPIREAGVNQATAGVVSAGVTMHKRLGAAGGGHSDPGLYPLKRVLRWARFYNALLR